MNGDADPREMRPRAREAAVRAVRGEPTLGEAHAALAAIDFMLDWDWPAAEAGYRRATVLAPSFALGHVMLAHVLSQMGRHGEAGVPMRPSLELEPLSGLLLAMSSQVAFQARDFAAAAGHARRAILVDPEFWVGHMMHGQVCEQLGQHDAAIDALTTSARLSGSNSKPVSLRGFVLAKMERWRELTKLEMFWACSRGYRQSVTCLCLPRRSCTRALVRMPRRCGGSNGRAPSVMCT
jgi:cytochrome c-type biogenesis protein CcmH/NrfG